MPTRKSLSPHRHAIICTHGRQAAPASAEALSAWVGARLAAHEAALAALLAVEGPRTPENSLRLYDAAIEQLNLAGAQAGVLNSVAADKAVRDQAQEEAQRVAQAGSALSLNRAGLRGSCGHRSGRRQRRHQALCRAHAARLPAGRRGQGPGHARPLASPAREGHAACRSNSAATSRRAARPSRPRAAELDGLPADYLARHPAGRRRPRHAHHRPARHAAGDDLCRQRRAARAHVPGLQHPRLPGQPADSAGPAGHAAGDCHGARLPQLGRPGHRRPDDGLGGQRAHLPGQARRGQPGGRTPRTRADSRFRPPAPARI